MSRETRPITRLVRMIDIIADSGAKLPPRVEFLRAVVKSIHTQETTGLHVETDQEWWAHMHSIDRLAEKISDAYGRPRKDALEGRMSQAEFEMMMSQDEGMELMI